MVLKRDTPIGEELIVKERREENTCLEILSIYLKKPQCFCSIYTNESKVYP